MLLFDAAGLLVQRSAAPERFGKSHSCLISIFDRYFNIPIGNQNA
jgi:hypothetical protein